MRSVKLYAIVKYSKNEKTSANGKLLGRIGWTTSDIVVLSEHFRVSTDYLLGLDADHEEVA